jgi:hypothetical protein
VAWNEPELLDLHDRLMDLLELWNFTETPDVDPTNYADVRVMPMLVGGVVARR